MNRHDTALELPKVLAKLAEQAVCAESKERILELVPMKDLSAVENGLQKTNDAFTLLAKFGGPSFRGIKHVGGALSRAAAGGVLNMRELLDVAELLRGVRALSEWRSHCEGVHTALDAYFEGLIPNKYLEEKIFSCILSEDEMADNASHELSEIRRKIRVTSSKIRDQLDKMIRSSHYQKYLQEAIVTFRNGRFVVPVKNEHRNEVPGMVHDTSASGATVFVEPAGVVQANNDIKVLQAKEREEIERILAELSEEAASFSESIALSYANAIDLDMIFAKAQLAYQMKASVPHLNAEGKIHLKKARHPLIPADRVVPTDIQLGYEFDTLVVTGPNTGGKTVSIKTLGLLTEMAMCGMMIPAGDQSELSVFEHILVDIGDEQSIEQSLSTFSGHMTNIVGILNVANEKSLILIDELGAGTDPVEGAALAMAILEKLHEKGAKIAATTHYAELKAYALQTPRVENACCEFDVETLRPTYKLLIGIPGRSNAFAISARLGMQDDVIDRAKELVSSENTRFESVVEKLETTRRALSDEREKVQALSEQAMQDSAEARAQKETIQQLKEQELERARGEALRITEKAKREAYALLEELNQLKKQQKSLDAQELARRAKSQIKSGLNKLDDITAQTAIEADDDEAYTLPRELKVGDAVFVRDLKQEAEVTAPLDKKGQVEIQAGLLKMRVKQDRLRLIERAKKPVFSKSRTVRTESRAQAEVRQECNLRGKTVEEALMELDSFLDRAMLLGLEELTVIHGKGTGALRSAVSQHLRTHPSVKSQRLGAYGEGDSGVTIVTMK